MQIHRILGLIYIAALSFVSGKPALASQNNSNCSGDFSQIINEIDRRITCRAAGGLRSHVEASMCENRRDSAKQFMEIFCSGLNKKNQGISSVAQTSVAGTDANRGAQCGNREIHERAAALEEGFQRGPAPSSARSMEELFGSRIRRARQQLSAADVALRELPLCLSQAGNNRSQADSCVVRYREPLNQVFDDSPEFVARNSGGFAERIRNNVREYREEEALYRRAHQRMQTFLQESNRRIADSRARVQAIARGGTACPTQRNDRQQRREPAAAAAPLPPPRPRDLGASQSAPLPPSRPAEANRSWGVAQEVVDRGRAGVVADERYPHTWNSRAPAATNNAYNPNEWGGGNLTPQNQGRRNQQQPRTQQQSPPQPTRQIIIHGIGF